MKNSKRLQSLRRSATVRADDEGRSAASRRIALSGVVLSLRAYRNGKWPRPHIEIGQPRQDASSPEVSLGEVSNRCMLLGPQGSHNLVSRTTSTVCRLYGQVGVSPQDFSTIGTATDGLHWD